jgi:hypothetical protein
MDDSPNTAVGKKGLTLKHWLDQGVLTKEQYDASLHKLLESLLDVRPHRAAVVPPPATKLHGSNGRNTASRRRMEQLGSGDESFDGSQEGSENQSSDSDSEDEPEDEPGSKRRNPRSSRTHRMPSGKKKPSKFSKVDEIRVAAIATQQRTDGRVKITTSAKAKTPVYIIRADGVFPRLIGNQYTDSQGQTACVWVEDDQGIFNCTLCNTRTAVFNPIEHRFDTKMLHNSTKKHTNNLLDAMQFVDGEKPLHWAESANKYSECLPSHEELATGKVCK